MPVSISGTNGVTFPDSSLQAAAASPYVLKNRIINGAMVIDQRNAGASFTPLTTSSYSLDRWRGWLSQSSKFTVQQNAGSITPPAGFNNYLGITSSSAYTSLTADYFTLTQNIEGFNTADLSFGTANAKTITISFWVRSSLTGTFGGSIANSAENRAYVFTYSISSANTWEQKTITIAGDTTGTWLTTNGIGMQVNFSLGAGTTYGSGTANTWASSWSIQTSSCVNLVGTNGATFYITGVQLEQNTSATPFERRLYNQELANCQRYFWYLGGSTVAGDQYLASGHCSSTTNARVVVACPVSMRSSPTVSAGTASNYQVYAGDAFPTVTSLSIGGVSTSTDQVTSFGLTANVASGLTLGRGCNLLGANTSAKITFSSEL
jgi:hypothetical protein